MKQRDISGHLILCFTSFRAIQPINGSKINLHTTTTMGDNCEPTITPADFTRWNYGGLTQASQQEDEAGYTEFGDEVGGTGKMNIQSNCEISIKGIPGEIKIHILLKGKCNSKYGNSVHSVLCLLPTDNSVSGQRSLRLRSGIWLCWSSREEECPSSSPESGQITCLQSRN